jgi:hypothetical protein
MLILQNTHNEKKRRKAWKEFIGGNWCEKIMIEMFGFMQEPQMLISEYPENNTLLSILSKQL